MNTNLRILLMTTAGNEAQLKPYLEELAVEQLTVVNNAVEALEALASGIYDLTLFDHEGTPEHCIEFIQAIQAKFPNHYTVLLTKRVEPKLVHQAVINGVSGILSHPLSKKKLQYELEKFSIYKGDRQAEAS